MSNRVLKKTIAVLLAIMLLLSLTACGTDGNDASDQQSVLSSQTDTNDATQNDGPFLVAPKYPTDDTIVAVSNVVVFGADPTGKKDSTSAVRAAVAAATVAGGGTVWFPAGQYLITGRIDVSTMVTLRGDWQDPSDGSDYGTILLCKPSSADSDNSGLFVMNDNSGIIGMTFYYPEQDINNVKPYPYTIWMKDGSLRTVKNCTFINSYRGIGTEHHEMCQFENLKGTFLKEGIYLTNCADVGTLVDIDMSPDYWANASAPMKKADAKAIAEWSKDNESFGMAIGDVEWDEYLNISIRGFTYGVLFPCKPTRYMGFSSFYNMNISDCLYGMYAQPGTYTSTKDGNQYTALNYICASVLTNSSVSGERYSIYNGTTAISGQIGHIKLCGVKLNGPTHGLLQTTSLSNQFKVKEFTYKTTAKSTGKYFSAINKGQSEEEIQAALDAAGKAGGGTVYVSAGKYEITSGLTVPANVELKGASGVSQRIASYGTVFHVKQSASSRAQTDTKAAVTLNGDNAGVSGIHFLYEANILSINASATYQYYPYTIRGNGKSVYAVNCCISGATHGIDFTDCNEHLISHLVSCAIEKSVVVGGDNGTVIGCLSNATVMYRNRLTMVNEGETMFKNYFIPIGRKITEYITVKEGKNQQVINCFIYGGLYNLVCDGGKDVLAINIAHDGIGDTGSVISMRRGNITIANSLRSGGRPYNHTGGALKLYNQSSVKVAKESDLNFSSPQS